MPIAVCLAFIAVYNYGVGNAAVGIQQGNAVNAENYSSNAKQ